MKAQINWEIALRELLRQALLIAQPLAIFGDQHRRRASAGAIALVQLLGSPTCASVTSPSDKPLQFCYNFIEIV